jgi:hypothetical protein
MRQRTDPEKLKKVYEYHEEILALFNVGKYDGKMRKAITDKCEELDVCETCYWTYRGEIKMKQ